MVHDEHNHLVLSYANASVTLVLAIVAVFGNWVIVGLFCKYKNLRNINNTAVTFLSICDLLRSSIVMTIKIYNHFLLANDLIEPFCTLTAFTSAFTFVFNPMLLALIAVIRYIKIVPWKASGVAFTFKKLYLASFCLMLVAVFFACLPLIGVGHYAYSESHGVCFTNWEPENKVFRTIFYIIVVGLAFPILMICYAKLFLVLREHKLCVYENHVRNLSDDSVSRDEPQKEGGFKTLHFLRNLGNKRERQESTSDILESTEVPSSDLTSSQPHTSNGNQKTSFRKAISQQEYRVTYLMIIIFIAYCVCWIPAAIVNIIALDQGPQYLDVAWYYVIVTLVELKAALNPVIYGFGNFQYRKALKRMLSCS